MSGDHGKNRGCPAADSRRDLRDAFDEFMEAFDGFKSANDQRLAALEARGHSDPLTDEKLRRIEAQLTHLETAGLRPRSRAPLSPETGRCETRAALAVSTRFADWRVWGGTWPVRDGAPHTHSGTKRA